MFTGIPGFIILLHSTGIPFFFFKQIEPLWQPWVKHNYQYHFPNSFYSLCISVSHFGNSLNISHMFTIIVCEGDLCLVNFEVTIIIVWGHDKPSLYKTVSLINKRYVLWHLCKPAIFLSLSISSGPPISWDTTVLKLS